MLALLSFLFVVSYAQDYNCPAIATTDCTTVLQSNICSEHYEFSWNTVTADPIAWPVHCVDDPNSSEYCISTPKSPSTPTTGFCKPNCVTSMKNYFISEYGCPETGLYFCPNTVSICTVNNTECGWCALDTITNTCYAPFLCNSI